MEERQRRLANHMQKSSTGGIEGIANYLGNFYVDKGGSIKGERIKYLPKGARIYTTSQGIEKGVISQETYAEVKERVEETDGEIHDINIYNGDKVVNRVTIAKNGIEENKSEEERRNAIIRRLEKESEEMFEAMVSEQEEEANETEEERMAEAAKAEAQEEARRREYMESLETKRKNKFFSDMLAYCHNICRKMIFTDERDTNLDYFNNLASELSLIRIRRERFDPQINDIIIRMNNIIEIIYYLDAINNRPKYRNMLIEAVESVIHDVLMEYNDVKQRLHELEQEIAEAQENDKKLLIRTPQVLRLKRDIVRVRDYHFIQNVKALPTAEKKSVITN